MPYIATGVNFIVTGMAVVFFTLAVMSAAMWLAGRIMKSVIKAKNNRIPEKPQKEIGALSESELAAVCVAVHEYTASEEKTTLNFEHLFRWKAQGRSESLERGL
jgi:sodium pump decarboxylase gamma subunit